MNRLKLYDIVSLYLGGYPPYVIYRKHSINYNKMEDCLERFLIDRGIYYYTEETKKNLAKEELARIYEKLQKELKETTPTMISSKYESTPTELYNFLKNYEEGLNVSKDKTKEGKEIQEEKVISLFKEGYPMKEIAVLSHLKFSSVNDIIHRRREKEDIFFLTRKQIEGLLVEKSFDEVFNYAKENNVYVKRKDMERLGYSYKNKEN